MQWMLVRFVLSGPSWTVPEPNHSDLIVFKNHVLLLQHKKKLNLKHNTNISTWTKQFPSKKQQNKQAVKTH